MLCAAGEIDGGGEHDLRSFTRFILMPDTMAFVDYRTLIHQGVPIELHSFISGELGWGADMMQLRVFLGPKSAAL